MYLGPNVPTQCVGLLNTYNLNIEENEVGPDSYHVMSALTSLLGYITQYNQCQFIGRKTMYI